MSAIYFGRTNWLVRLLGAVFAGWLAIFAASPAWAAPVLTVLEYPEAQGAALTPMPVPESVFHNWADSRKDAQGLVDAWRDGQPATVPLTRLMLGRYIKHKIMPTRAARGLALAHVAMHDAWQLAPANGEARRLAVTAAMARVLSYLFPTEEGAFQRVAFSAASLLSSAPLQDPPPAMRDALALGDLVGRRVVARGESDGAQRGWNGVRLQWYGDGRYYGPGAWEPTPPYFYYPPDEPFAPGWKPWVLADAGQFRPTPPGFGTERYIRDLQELVDINRNLTPAQLAIARKWVDGHGTTTPPGRWNDIAIGLVLKHKLDDSATVRLFLRLNLALADSFIACWDAKYYHWTMRPVTAAKYLLGITIEPAILTPPFPSFVSGHATFSGAAARVLGRQFPDESAQLESMAEEAAFSRLLGGIHFRHDNEDGLTLGRKVAEVVLQRY
jgi:membrane-associated phospholipid phosphatase